ncbi:MAG: DUF4376 domain-containing protein [Neptunomonas phycophila]|uniref:DUF4376 domain-containing protein n=1 Tax=Neptunomonas phycophila TaxID=1572645 RepID=UPI003B8AE69A
MVYAQWDLTNNTILIGPTKLPSGLNTMSEAELNAVNWYQCNITHTIEPYNNEFHDVTSIVPTLNGNKIDIMYNTAWKPVEELREYVNANVNAHRDEMTMAGFIFGGIKFDSDEAARNNITGSITTINSGLLVEAANPGLTVLPPSLDWTSFDNSTVTLTPMEMIDLGLRMSSWFSGVFSAARAHKDAILAIPTPQAIIEYDYKTTLWPANNIGGTIASLTPPA